MKTAHCIIASIITCQFCYAQNWQVLSGGASNRAARVLYTDTIDQLLYAGGMFSEINGIDSMRGIAAYDGQQWDSLDTGIDDFNTSFPNNVYAITRYNNEIYAGGGFTKAGSLYSRFLARWNGSNWDSIQGGQPNGSVNHLLVDGGNLYACGTFDTIGGIAASGIARWDGAAWYSVGNYPFVANSGIVSRICMYNGNLYAAGVLEDQTQPGIYRRLAKWDGTNWTLFSTILLGSLDGINDLIAYQGELFVAGLFTTTTGNAGNGIMKWNGTNWSAVGGGIAGITNPYPAIEDMAIHNNELFCVGNFEIAGGLPAHSIAKWNGVDWCSFGSTFDNKITSIGFLNNQMYISGGFWNVDSMPMSYMAHWVGGNYTDSCGNTTGISEAITPEITISVYPNPGNGHIIFELPKMSESTTIRIYSLLGNEIWAEKTDSGKADFFAGNFSPGMYLFAVYVGKKILKTGKLIISD